MASGGFPIDGLWLAIGFGGQVLFSMRFLIQWWRSECARRSVMPTAFWYFSLGGGLILLAYALHQRDPVFIVGQLTGVFIYARNLYFVYRERQSPAHTEHTASV